MYRRLIGSKSLDKLIFNKAIFNKFIKTNKTIKRSPDKWGKLLNILIIDPDGWNRSNYDVDWKKKLTLSEFIQKASNSTARFSYFYNLFIERYFRNQNEVRF